MTDDYPYGYGVHRKIPGLPTLEEMLENETSQGRAADLVYSYINGHLRPNNDWKLIPKRYRQNWKP